MDTFNSQLRLNSMNLYQFEDPKLMFDSIDTSPTDFIYSTKYQKEREARILSVFGIGWQLIENKKCLVRLVNEMEPTEAQIKIDAKEYNIQICMCIEPQRQIGAEYKMNTVYEKERPVDLTTLYNVIKENIQKKLNKYGSGQKLNLLFYINMNYTGVTPKGLTTTMSEISKLNFESIWAILDTYKNNDEGGTELGFALAKLFPSECKGFFTFSKNGTAW